MNDVVIRAEGISKKYRVGQAPVARSLRDAMANAAGAPSRKFKELRAGDQAEKITDFWALRDVSFEVNRGDVVGIIGRNGAGKSTLLKVLSRITDPTEGSIELQGRVASLLEVGTGFHPDLTGRENISLNGAILGMRRAEVAAKFDEIVAFAEVEKFIDTQVKNYSSGMYLRLAFAVAAHLEPEILIVDEVLAVGDANFQKKCLGKMQDVAGQGRTVLFVSHNMPAVMRLCSRAIMLDAGRLVQSGTAAEIVAFYLAGSGGSDGTRSWDAETAPGTGAVKLLSVQLLANGCAATVVSVGDEVQLQMTYRVDVPGLAFRCTTAFYTQGVCAFGTVEPTESERPQAGVYQSSVTVPAHTFSEGEYSVSVSLLASRGIKARYVFEKEVIVFQVTDAIDGSSARGDYAEHIAGVVRPHLAWTTQLKAD